jgi:hypothetical protein
VPTNIGIVEVIWLGSCRLGFEQIAVGQHEILAHAVKHPQCVALDDVVFDRHTFMDQQLFVELADQLQLPRHKHIERLNAGDG